MSSNQDCVHMLWIIPQYFLMVTAEVMFYITAMDFAYTQVCIYSLSAQIGNNYIIFVLGPKKHENNNSGHGNTLCSIWKRYSYDCG
jgi:dipeptide/tripeptide permease